MLDLNKEPSPALHALAAMRSPGGEALLKFFERMAEDARRKLVHAGDMREIHRLQERAVVFEEMLSAPDEAQKVLSARARNHRSTP